MINLNRIYFITKINGENISFFLPKRNNDFQSTPQEDFPFFFPLLLFLFFIEFGSKQRKEKEFIFNYIGIKLKITIFP